MGSCERDESVQLRKIVLSIGIDLERMAETSRAREIETLHYRGAFTLIGFESMYDYSAIRRMKCRQHFTRGCVTAVINNEHREIDRAQAPHHLARGMAVVIAGNDRATLETHSAANPIRPDEHGPPASTYSKWRVFREGTYFKTNVRE